MALRKFNPITPGMRHKVLSKFEEITTDKPHKPLLEPIKKSGGRNADGKMTMRYRGGGHKRRYRVIDFKRNKHMEATVLRDDGLLYAMEQPVPMPDIEYPSPLQRDNSYETLANQTKGLVTPVRIGVDMQLTRRVHASLAFTSIPNGARTWNAFQAGVGFQLGRGKEYVKTLFPEEFLAIGVDVDGVGVKDHKDRCGMTEPGAKVDKHGCAIDTDADGVPDHRDLELNSPDMLVNDDGVSISLAEWKALYGPAPKDPSTFDLDSLIVANEHSASEMAAMLSKVKNTADATEREMLKNLRSNVYSPQLTY
ncbi:MAG: hypothetical protein CL822_04260, partial [Crocinitomicaceae bacterium]|nr:hypothetical protein [Crocinitomicaceae bacterium]